MTLACGDGYLQDNAVLVAVNEYPANLLEMAALLAFLPELLSRPAVIDGLAGGYSQVQCLFVHVGSHQYLVCLFVLCDSRYQARTVELRDEISALFDIFIFCQFQVLLIAFFIIYCYWRFYPLSSAKTSFFKVNWVS